MIMTDFLYTLYNSYAAVAESIYSDVFFWILNTSISASFLVAAIVILRLILKKAPKALFVALWGLVALRLVCPFTIESALSLVPSAETIPTEQFYYQETRHDDYNLALVDNPIYPEAVAYTVPGGVESTSWDFMFFYFVWLGGIGAMLIYTAVSYIIVRRKVKMSAPLRENIRICDGIKTPFILGIIKPKIYIPSDMNEQDTEYVIAHEKAHLKRRDHWWKPLGFLLLSVHWFNPVMWAAYILLCRDIELACDEKVIKSLGTESKKLYSEALLNCSIPRKMIAACPLAFGEVGVKQRIKSVLNYKKPAFWIIIIAVIASIVVAVCFMTNPPGSSIDEVSHGLFIDNYRISVVSGEKAYNISSTSAIDEAARFLEEIRIGKAPVSDSISESRPSDYKIIFFKNKEHPELYTTLNFSEDLTEMWVDNGVKPSKSYRVKNPQKLRQLFDVSMEKYLSDGYGNTDVQWDYMPMLSWMGYYCFPIQIDLDYDSVKAGCSAGELIDYDVTYPDEPAKGNVVEFDKGHHNYWCPTTGAGETVAEAEISLWIYKDYKTIHEAKIKIVREPFTENAYYSSYTASLTSESDIVMVQAETGGRIISADGLADIDSGITLLTEENYEQAAKALDSDTVSFFDSQIFGDKIFVGCEYYGKLGFAVFSKDDNGYKLEYTAKQEQFYERGAGVFTQPYTSRNSGTFQVILSTNEELARISFTGDYEKTFLVNHAPALIVADQTAEFNNREPAGFTSQGFTFSYDFYDKTGNLLSDAASQPITIDPLTEAIRNAVISHNQSDLPDGLFRCVSVEYIEVNEFSGTPVEGKTEHFRGYTAKTMIKYCEFTFSGGMLNEAGGFHKYMTFNFEVDESGEYFLMEYSEPETDKLSYNSLPIDPDTYLVGQMQDCYAQAVQYYKINTDAVIENLFNKIASANIDSDNAADYLNACPDEESELIYYGDYTLKYIFSEFLKGGQTDMRGKIMRRVMDNLIGGEALKLWTENGQEYFDHWKQKAIEIQNTYGMEHVEKNMPKAAMLLEMM